MPMCPSVSMLHILAILLPEPLISLLASQSARATS
jgi:hypothetical protein